MRPSMHTTHAPPLTHALPSIPNTYSPCLPFAFITLFNWTPTTLQSLRWVQWQDPKHNHTMPEVWTGRNWFRASVSSAPSVWTKWAATRSEVSCHSSVSATATWSWESLGRWHSWIHAAGAVQHPCSCLGSVRVRWHLAWSRKGESGTTGEDDKSTPAAVPPGNLVWDEPSHGVSLVASVKVLSEARQCPRKVLIDIWRTFRGTEAIFMPVTSKVSERRCCALGLGWPTSISIRWYRRYRVSNDRQQRFWEFGKADNNYTLLSGPSGRRRAAVSTADMATAVSKWSPVNQNDRSHSNSSINQTLFMIMHQWLAHDVAIHSSLSMYNFSSSRSVQTPGSQPRTLHLLRWRFSGVWPKAAHFSMKQIPCLSVRSSWSG